MTYHENMPDEDFEVSSEQLDREAQDDYEAFKTSIKEGTASSSAYIFAVYYLRKIKNHPDKNLINSYLEKAFVLAQQEYRDYEKRNEAVVALGQYYEITKNYEKAAQYYEEAVRQNPEIFYFLINLYIEKLHDKKRAIAAFEKAKTAGIDGELLHIMDPNNHIDIKNIKRWYYWFIGAIISVIILYTLSFYLLN